MAYNFAGASEYLYFHRVLVQPSDKNYLNGLWGKLASEILMQNWDAALDELKRLQAFIDEARTLARCDHPSLLRIVRLLEANGTAYSVMPYYVGRRLTDVRRDAIFALGQYGARAVPDLTRAVKEGPKKERNYIIKELGDLESEAKAGAEGAIIESKLEVGRGPTATVIIQKGTLKAGDSIVCGS